MNHANSNPSTSKIKLAVMVCVAVIASALAGCAAPKVHTERDSAVNLRTQFCRIIRRAGFAPWPKLWHNLRASRESELL